MELLWQIPLWLVGTAIFDWIVAGRLAALVPSVDYHYWPISTLRLVTLTFLSAAIAVAVCFGYRAEWPLLPSLAAFVIYGAAIMADLERQRERGPLPQSLRYGETDADY
ncbi:MAG TPA: hypothetical protein VM145_03760 [Sphingomicrobium sp.]|nr:hypothetical protein [Sphingomicrobium sp.]